MGDETQHLSMLFFSRLQAIETERLPQVLAICYSDKEEGGDDDDDDDEEDSFCDVRKHNSDEAHGAEKHGSSRDTASPVSSLQGLSPGK